MALVLILLLCQIYNVMFQMTKLGITDFLHYLFLQTVTENMAIWNDLVNKAKSKNYYASSLKKIKLTQNLFILKIVCSH